MNHSTSSVSGAIRSALLALLLSAPLAGLAADPQTFATPEAAVDALLAALKANNEAALVALVGSDHRKLVGSGDAASDAALRAEVATHLQTFRALDASAPDRRIVLIGAQGWPLPIPLVRQGAGWRFDAAQGAEEMLNRRIGRNERNAINVLHAYLNAQREYASRDRNDDGVLEYAQRLGSTAGRHDGLYWPTSARDDDVSPFGPLVADAGSLEGRQQGSPFRGYHFRILTRQGNHAPGGAYSYLINGRLIGGFAMVAYPASYGDSGVTTFLVSHNGKVYERDLGRSTGRIAAGMASFDPGPGWKVTAP